LAARRPGQGALVMCVSVFVLLSALMMNPTKFSNSNSIRFAFHYIHPRRRRNVCYHTRVVSFLVAIGLCSNRFRRSLSFIHFIHPPPPAKITLQKKKKLFLFLSSRNHRIISPSQPGGAVDGCGGRTEAAAGASRGRCRCGARRRRARVYPPPFPPPFLLPREPPPPQPPRPFARRWVTAAPEPLSQPREREQQAPE
jgi:hypothetical protein